MKDFINNRILRLLKLSYFFTRLTYQLEKFLSNILSIQVITGGICICGSVYILAFVRQHSILLYKCMTNLSLQLQSVSTENLVEYVIYVFILFYNILDIFMIMYFGNEIKLSSGRFSYCLFESDWIDQSQSYKKCLLIFGERLQMVHQMLILKLYPLNMETFTTVST